MNVKLGVRFLIAGAASFVVALLGNTVSPWVFGNPPDALTLLFIFLAVAGLLSIVAGLLCALVSAWKWTARP